MKNYKNEVLYTLIASESTTKIKLGCKEGGGFFYIGPCSDFLRDLDEWNKKEKDRFEARRVSLYNSFMNGIETYPNSAQYLKNRLKSSEGDTIGTYEEYQSWMARAFKQLENRLARINKLKEQVYQTLETRRIEDFYKSIDEPDTYICLIEGHIAGEYWTSKEYETGVVERDTEEEE